jgi:hypothetical protein
MKKNMVSSNISQCLIEPTNVRNTHGVHVLQGKTPKNDTQWQLAYQFSEKSMRIRALGQQKNTRDMSINYRTADVLCTHHRPPWILHLTQLHR